MAMSDTDTATFGGHPFTLKLSLTVASQSVTTNKSTINWSLKAIKTGNFTPVTYDDSATWSFSKDGSGHWGPYNFNGSIGQTVTVASGSFTFTHDADGGGGFSYTYHADGKSTITTASGSGSFTPNAIPRATVPTVSPTSGPTDATYAIDTSTVASSTFFHDTYYSIDGGTTYTSIATNEPASTTSRNWSPASSLIPNNTSVTAIIRVDTRSSSAGTIIGTKTVNLPLTVPSTVKPSVSSVAWSDVATSPNIPTLIGAFVQRWSLLKPTVTAVGTGGATIASSSVTMGGQTTPSGTAFSASPTVSGACAYSANAIDSRNVPSDPYINTVAVLAYNNPNLPNPLVQRTSDAAGAVQSPTGTYLAITPAASVSDLTVGGTQKNLLEWQVETRPVGGSFTVIQAWTNATVSGTTWTTKKVIGGYASTTAYEVRVSVRDLFGKNGFDTTNTVKSATITVPSETVFMDWNQGVGVGLNKYHALGFLDVGGDIYMNGNKVMDYSVIATSAETIAGVLSNKVVSPQGLADVTSTSSRRGLVQLATPTEAVAGTDALKAVTVAGVAAAAAAAVLNAPGMTLVRTATQSIPNGSGTFTTATYTATPQTSGAFTQSGGVLTCVRAGTYLVSFATTFAANSTNNRFGQLLQNATVVASDHKGATSATTGIHLPLFAVVTCVAGDTITANLAQTSGGSLNVNGTLLSVTAIT